jgi:hypothetical protein
MLINFMASIRQRSSEAGQGIAEYFLIVAPLTAFLALTICTLVIANNRFALTREPSRCP